MIKWNLKIYVSSVRDLPYDIIPKKMLLPARAKTINLLFLICTIASGKSSRTLCALFENGGPTFTYDMGNINVLRIIKPNAPISQEWLIKYWKIICLPIKTYKMS